MGLIRTLNAAPRSEETVVITLPLPAGVGASGELRPEVPPESPPPLSPPPRSKVRGAFIGPFLDF